MKPTEPEPAVLRTGLENYLLEEEKDFMIVTDTPDKKQLNIKSKKQNKKYVKKVVRFSSSSSESSEALQNLDHSDQDYFIPSIQSQSAMIKTISLCLKHMIMQLLKCVAKLFHEIMWRRL